MVVKGIIQDIDFNSNNCKVRLPFFENAGNKNEIVVNAVFANNPGVYNGYKVDDVVFVDFENNDFDQAVVTGKLYLGADVESKSARGAFNISALTVDGSATIPITTKLSFPGNNETTVGVENDLTTYKSIEDIARNLQKQETQIGSINAQIIDSGDGLGARVTKLEEDDIRHESEIIINTRDIRNKVSKEQGATSTGFGWVLDDHSWTLKAYNSSYAIPEIDIFKVDAGGVTIQGDENRALRILGYPKENRIRYMQVPGVNYGCYYNSLTGEWSYDHDYVYLNSDGIPAEKAPPHETKAEIDLWVIQDEPTVDPSKYTWKLSYTVTYSYNNNMIEESYVNVTVEIFYKPTNSIFDPNSGIGLPPVNSLIGGGGSSSGIVNVGTQALSIAMGKSTNYYSDKEPYGNIEIPDPTVYTYAQSLKIGDNWFDTKYIDAGIPSKLTEYYGKYVLTDSSGTIPPHDTYTQVTPDNIQTLIDNNKIILGITHAYTYGELYQCKAIDSNGKADWEPIGSELVLNKLTANYINALDIETKKITVLQDSSTTGSPILFEADGTSQTGSVTIGGFEVGSSSLTASSSAGDVSLSAEGITVGDKFAVNANGEGIFSGSLSASSLMLNGLPMNTYRLASGGATEYYTVTINSWSPGSTHYDTFSCTFTVNSFSDPNHTTPVNVAANRSINVILTITYTGPMGGYYTTSKSTIVTINEGTSSVTDTLQGDFGLYWATGVSAAVSPDYYTSNKGDFKNEYGYFLDSLGCCTQSFYFKFSEMAWPEINWFVVQYDQGSYRTVVFNLSSWLNNQTPRFSRVYGFNVQLISHINTSNSWSDIVKYNNFTAAATQEHRIVTIAGKNAIQWDSTNKRGFFIPNDSSQQDDSVDVIFGASHDMNKEFKSSYDASVACFDGLALTVYGVPK